jgi:hypothetical protein
VSQEKKPTPPCSGDGASPAASGVAPCTPPEDPCGKDAISNVTKCCGTEIVEEAKKANGGKDPNIVFGTPSRGRLAETYTSTGTIIVSSASDKCRATESVYFELNNLASKPKFDKTSADAAAGNLSQEDYVRAIENIEYENVKKTLDTVDKCKKKWGCESSPFVFDGFRGVKNFEDYYKTVIEKHKQDYRDDWTKNFKAAYDAKQASPNPPK